MVKQTSFLVPPYSALADVYDQAGYTGFAEQAAPLYIQFAQSLDWAGRRVLEIGCGTGVTTWWLVQRGYRVAGIDSSSHMLEQARGKADLPENQARTAPDFVQMDIRQLESPLGVVDLVLAVGGVMNAIPSLRDLETVFNRVNRVLDPGKLFVFDLRTIRGLVENNDVVDYDNETDLLITVRNRFSHETLTLTRQYIILRRQGDGWQRQDEIHTERGYPIQGISTLLERTGFRVAAIVEPGLEPFDPQVDTYGRAVFVAEKQP